MSSDAATSVLNAYGLSAKSATRVVDQFVQTQNDGKIVVDEYAKNIGKVASAAAGLGIPLSEVNAAIAQSTIAGVDAERVFTGLKVALARLASGEAANAIKETGIDISAASLEAEGLFGTLKKLDGLDVGKIFKALGAEAGPALLPVLNNLEEFRKSAGLTQQELSESAEVSRKSINAIENGIYVPSTVLALKIAKTLNCSVEDLFQLPVTKSDK